MNEVDSILRAQVEKHHTPSVHYIIFDQDTIIHRFHTGLADIINQKSIEDNTTFKAFSVTKTFTALAILQLHEKGRLNIYEPVVEYFPDFHYSSDITTQQLMAHSSGIPNPNPLSWIHLEEEHQTFDGDKFFGQIFTKHFKTRSKPNERFSYSNLGYVLLGQLIEHVSEQDYEDYIQDNIIRPLDIGPGELNFDVFDKHLHARGYQRRFSFMNGILGFFLDKSKYMGPSESKWKPFKNFYVNGPSYGGLIGTPDGFRKYIQELLKANCLLISDETKKVMFNENITNTNEATGMCLSWFRGTLNGQEYFTHAGGGGGYYCEIRIYRSLGMGSVIMYNRSGMRDERFLDKLDKYYIN